MTRASRRNRGGAGSGSSDAGSVVHGDLDDDSSDECIIVDVDIGADGTVVGAETVLEAAFDSHTGVRAAAPLRRGASSSSSSVVVVGGGGARSTSASGFNRGGASASAAAGAPINSATVSSAAAAVAIGARDSESLLLSELHAAAVSIDLHGAPVRGDSWLTSTLIDAVTFELARAYPVVHFLPTNVLAFELPHASKTGRLAAYSCTDLSGRRVALRADAPTAMSLPQQASAVGAPAVQFGGGWISGPPPPGYRPPTFAAPNRTLITFWNQGQLHWNLVRGGASGSGSA